MGVEWVEDGRVNMLQRFTITSTGRIFTGQYRLQVPGKIWTKTGRTNVIEMTNKCIDFNAPADVVKMALETVSSIDHVTVTRTGDGTAASKWGYVYDIEYDGELLNYGDLGEIEVVHMGTEGCDSWKSDGIVATNITVERAAQQGAVPEIVTVRTSVDPGSTVSGDFDLSVDFIGELDKEIQGLYTVYPGSSTVLLESGSTNDDCRTFINRGDKVRIGNETFIVHPTDRFTCKQIPLSSYHTTGAYNAKMYVMNTRIGTVYKVEDAVISSRSSIGVDDLQDGEYIMFGSYWNKMPSVYQIASRQANGRQFTLDRVFNGTFTSSISIYKR